jgi:acyl carrier protein
MPSRSSQRLVRRRRSTLEFPIYPRLDDEMPKVVTAVGLSSGESVGCAVIFDGLREKYRRTTSHQDLRRMSARETLRTTLLNLLEEEMGEKYPVLQDDQDLRETLGLDSVDVVGLVMRIEREFRVRLSPEELANVKVVGDLLGLMETKLAERPDVPVNGEED